jgi:3-dehydrosphinganine reductase
MMNGRAGMERNDFYITYEPVGHMLRTSRGITPRNSNFLADQFWGIVGSVRFLSPFSPSEQ